MAIGGAFLGGGVEVVPAGSCKLELEILTEDRKNLTATFTIKGTSTYTVTAGADGRAVYTVPAGQTYTVSVNTTGYDNIASQTVVAESGTVRYVRFEAFEGRVKRSGDTMTGPLTTMMTGWVWRTFAGDYDCKNPTTNDNRPMNLSVQEKNGLQMMNDFLQCTETFTRRIINIFYRDTSGNETKRCTLVMESPKDGDSRITVPTPSSKQDNSTKIATTGWVNQTDFLVHSYGNETVSGRKTFTEDVRIKGLHMGDSGYVTRRLYFANADNTEDAGYVGTSVDENYSRSFLSVSRNIDGAKVTATLLLGLNPDGTSFVTCPTTPAYASTNEVATANWSIGKFVQKSGDTMTGTLIIQRVLPQAYLKHTSDDYTVAFTGSSPDTLKFIGYLDKNGKDTFHISEYVYNGGRGISIQLSDASSGSVKSANIGLTVEKIGNAYATAPTPSSKQDNSIKIATTAWVNQTNFLVHTTGNETVSGAKVFTSSPSITSGWLWFKNSENQNVGGINSSSGKTYMRCYNSTTGERADLNVRCLDNGDKYGTAPSPPTDANSNEIATANWVNTKLAQKSKVTAVTSYTQLMDLIKNGKRGDSFGLTMDYTGSAFGGIMVSGVETHVFGHYTLEELTVADGNLKSFQAFGSGEVSGKFIENDNTTYTYATTGFGRAVVLQGYGDAFRVVEDGKLTYFLTTETTTSFDGYYISI